MSGQPPPKRTRDNSARPRRTNAAPMPPSDDATAATTIFGAAHLNVRHSFPDATPREFEWAVAMMPGEPWFTDTRRGVRRVRALRDARRREPTLSDDAWWAYIDEVTPRLSEAEREDTSAILAAVRRRIDIEIEVHRRARRADEPEWHGLTERMIRETAAEVRRGTSDGPPRQSEVARRLYVSVSKLQRAMKHFEIGHWPPAPPRD